MITLHGYETTIEDITSAIIENPTSADTLDEQCIFDEAVSYSVREWADIHGLTMAEDEDGICTFSR